MKKNTMFRILVTMVSMAAFALASPPASGQEQAIQAVPGGNEPVVEHLMVQDGILFKRLPGEKTNWVNCGDARMDHAVKVLRDLYPKVTFAMDPRVAAVPLTDVVVRGDDPNLDLEALRATSGGRFAFHYERGGLFTIEHTTRTDVDPSASEDRGIECFNLTGYLQREKAMDGDGKNKGQGGAVPFGPAPNAVIDGLQAIIQKSIADFDASIGQPHFQFYPDAQMLIVIGSHRAIDIAGKVIHALPGQQNYNGGSAGRANYYRLQGADPTAVMESSGPPQPIPPPPPVADQNSNKP